MSITAVSFRFALSVIDDGYLTQKTKMNVISHNNIFYN